VRALGDAAWPDAERDAPEAILAVPVGSTEQHGPHLPLSTDTDIAVALAGRLAERVPGVVVAPPLPYGASGEHAAFAGTLSIGNEATELLLVELGRSASASFARMVLVSTHGGNAEPVERAAARLRAEGRSVLAWSPRYDGDAHAGRAETSIMLALDPARVRPHAGVAGNAAPIEALLPRLRAEGVRPLSPTGVLGDPAGASADEGRRLLDGAADRLVTDVLGWAAR
jgi:mycofactocin system creatininase family protein